MEIARTLTSGASGPPPDSSRHLWTPITIRVAWELVRAGVRPKGAVLQEAREHVLSLLPSQASLSDADLIAIDGTKDFVRRIQDIYQPWRPDPDLSIQPEARWRRDIQAALQPAHDVVFRLHFADGMPLEEVERNTRISRAALRAAREGIRSLVRQVLGEAKIEVTDWEKVRLDRLISRIANATDDGCPGPWGLVTPAGKRHAENCPRCSRAHRLMRAGYLNSADLTPPEDRCLPEHDVDLVCIQLAPEARVHLPLIRQTFGAHLRMNGEEILFLHAGTLVDLQDRLTALAENGTPSAPQMKMLRRSLRGRWGRHAILGRSPEWMQVELQSLSWGGVDGLDALPAPLPPPPSALRWWLSAALIFMVAALLGRQALLNLNNGPAISGQMHPEGLIFEAGIQTSVDIWGISGPNLVPLYHSTSPADKGTLAAGDGRYLLRQPAEAYLLIGQDSPLSPDLQLLPIIADARNDPDAEALLEQALPEANVEIIRPTPPPWLDQAGTWLAPRVADGMDRLDDLFSSP